jgi:hypothetical protein
MGRDNKIIVDETVHTLQYHLPIQMIENLFVYFGHPDADSICITAHLTNNTYLNSFSIERNTKSKPEYLKKEYRITVTTKVQK